MLSKSNKVVREVISESFTFPIDVRSEKIARIFMELLRKTICLLESRPLQSKLMNVYLVANPIGSMGLTPKEIYLGLNIKPGINVDCLLLHCDWQSAIRAL